MRPSEAKLGQVRWRESFDPSTALTAADSGWNPISILTLKLCSRTLLRPWRLQLLRSWRLHTEAVVVVAAEEVDQLPATSEICSSHLAISKHPGEIKHLSRKGGIQKRKSPKS